MRGGGISAAVLSDSRIGGAWYTILWESSGELWESVRIDGDACSRFVRPRSSVGIGVTLHMCPREFAFPGLFGHRN